MEQLALFFARQLTEHLSVEKNINTDHIWLRS